MISCRIKHITRGVQLFALFSFLGTFSSMRIVEFKQEILDDPSASTEHAIYTDLKNNSLKADVTFLATSVTWFINMGKLDELDPGVDVAGGFAFCHSDFYARALPTLEKLGIKALFAPSCADETYGNIRVLPCPFMAINAVGPAACKDIWYSFIGFNTHPVREKIVSLPSRRNVIIKRRLQWHFYRDPAIQQKEKEEYQDVLARSRFSLCPRGGGRASIRFWESLCAGAIPVVIPACDCYLPAGFDWDSCIITLEEEDIPRINQILKEISPEREVAMREQCYKAYEQFSGKNLTSCIRQYYEEGPWEAWTPVKAAALRLAAAKGVKKYHRIRSCAPMHRIMHQKGRTVSRLRR